MTGIIISIRMTSNSPDLLFSNISTASCPFHAFVTWAPSFWSKNSAISIFSSLSSTRRIFRSFMDLSDTFFCSLCLSASRSILNGTRSTKVVPLSLSLSKVIVPPIFSARFLVMVIPKPVPPNLEAPPFCSLAKDSKTCSLNPLLMPIPVSRHVNSSIVLSVLCDGISLQLRSMFP